MQSNQVISVAQFGLGTIGIQTLQLLVTKPWVKVVAGIDNDPAKTGKTLADVTGIKQLSGCPIFDSFDSMQKHFKADVIAHTAGSKVIETFDQLEPIVTAGVSVVSSCEELLYPWHRAHTRSDVFHSLCRQHGARVVGTGVNPGFVLDVLPICLSGVCKTVRGVWAERVVDVSTRRMQLQKKVGSGMDPDAFRALFKEGKAGHAGLQESVALIAHALGWKIDQIIETCEPVIAEREIKTQYFTVKPGQTCGLHQRGVATRGNDTPIVLDLTMALEAINPHDSIRLDSDPPMNLTIAGGTAGEPATVSSLVNAIPRLLNAKPGMLLMTDLAVPSFH